MNDETINLFGEGRGLVAAWALPHEGPLTESEMRSAMDNFLHFTKRHGIKLGQAAHEIGVKEKGIRSLLSGTFDENAERNVRALNAWVESRARRTAGKTSAGFVQTRVAKQIQDAARLAIDATTIALVMGPAGIGKSRCGRALAESIPGTVFVRGSVEISRTGGLFGVLGDLLGVRTSGRAQRRESGGSVVARVFAKLAGSHRLIVIDEADRLCDSALEGIRDLNDTEVPILLLATKDLHTRILEAADPDHGQFLSRVGVIVSLTTGFDSLQGDPRPLFTVDDIRRLYERPPVKLADGAAKYLKDIANDFGRGSLRRCGILLVYAAIAARNRQRLGSGDPVEVQTDDLDLVERTLRRDPSEADLIEDRRRRSVAVASA
jgi:DNA transposition AAA+ family ATPase